MNKNIVLGVTGGIAAYKSAEIVSLLVKKGADVFVVMTKNAARFISPLTFESISGNPVSVRMFSGISSREIEHISLAKKADIFLIAPASANFIGKIASGIADDMLTTSVTATKAPVFIAPAMNTNMYENEIVVENIRKLEARGYLFIGPESGRLACGDYGAGKMSDPLQIVDRIGDYLNTEQTLNGKKVLVTAGPTIEPIDAFRFISNHSSGKMGYALASEAYRMGAKVKLISGPVSLVPPGGVETVYVETALDMKNAVIEDDDFDILIKAAAVSDFRPEVFVAGKIKKTDIESQEVKLVKNPDILKTVSQMRSSGKAFKDTYLVGFAAETDDVLGYARRKRIDKEVDMIIANDIGTPGCGFKSDTNAVTVITKNGEVSISSKPKSEIAKMILQNIAGELDNDSKRCYNK